VCVGESGVDGGVDDVCGLVCGSAWLETVCVCVCVCVAQMGCRLVSEHGSLGDSWRCSACVCALCWRGCVVLEERADASDTGERSEPAVGAHWTRQRTRGQPALEADRDGTSASERGGGWGGQGPPVVRSRED
jgi:hypothetical protein